MFDRWMSPIEEVINALQELGYRKKKRITLADIDLNGSDIQQATVIYGGQEIGRYDFLRHTFVD